MALEITLGSSLDKEMIIYMKLVLCYGIEKLHTNQKFDPNLSPISSTNSPTTMSATITNTSASSSSNAVHLCS